MDYYGTHTDTIEDIGRIEIVPTIDEVQESTIIIEEET